MNKFVVKLPSAGSKRSGGTGSSGGSLSVKKQNKSQSCLSFGQKPTLPSRQQCPLCGMLFDAGVQGDIATHQKECSKMSIQGVTKIGSTKGHQLVHSYADDGGFVIQWNPSIKSASFVELFEKMNSDLGSPPDFHEDAKNIYVYIRDNIAAGCLVVDSIHKSKIIAISRATEDIAVPVLYCEKCDDEVSVTSSTEDKVLPSSTSSNTCTVFPGSDVGPSHYLGVRQIWISVSFRRQGIASRLVDCARKRFVLGSVVERHNVLFSQPTGDGLRLAKAYGDKEYLLVY